MERDVRLLQCSLCGRHMKFEGATNLEGTGKARLFDPRPKRSVELFSCECGRTESRERNAHQNSITT